MLSSEFRLPQAVEIACAPSCIYYFVFYFQQTNPMPLPYNLISNLQRSEASFTWPYVRALTMKFCSVIHSPVCPHRFEVLTDDA